MINPAQFRQLVIRPVVDGMGMGGPAVENLLLGTALVESGLCHLRQRPMGPALGVYQMEPATHADLWRSLAGADEGWRCAVEALMTRQPPLEQLATNLAYATAMCRLLYRRVPAPLPAADDLPGLAAYWKRHYNTPLGKGTPERFIACARDHLRKERS